MNDYVHLFTPKYPAQPYISFASGLRADEPFPKAYSRVIASPRIFSFYAQDMEKWAERAQSPGKEPRGPLKVIDFQPRGSSSMV